MLKKAMSILALSALLISGAGVAALPANAEGEEDETFFPVTVETDADDVTLNGFSLIGNDKASKKFHVGTYEAGATLKHVFRGTSLSLYGFKGAEGGKLSVKIDNESKGEVDLNAEEDSYKSLLAKYNLAYGEHTVEVTSVSGWVALDYMEISVPKSVYNASRNLALLGTVTVSVRNPTINWANRLGTRNFNVIKSEIVFPASVVGGYNSLLQQSYHSFQQNATGAKDFYMGYEFDEEFYFSKLVYQQGVEFGEGGWFEGGARVQVRQNDEWVDVPLTNDPGYNQTAPDGANYDVYTFEFDTVEGDGIRLFGAAGGSEHFVSVNQIEVYGRKDGKSLAEGGRTYKTAVQYEDTHRHNFALASVTQATCTEGGYTRYACSCGLSERRNATEPAGHNFDDGVITTQPTTEAEGVKTFTCSKCGATKTQSVAKLPDDGKTDGKDNKGCSGAAYGSLAAAGVALAATAVTLVLRRKKS